MSIRLAGFVAVDRTPVMEVLQTIESLLTSAPPPRPEGAAPRQHFVESLAFQILHDDVMDAVGVADLKGANHVRVVELRQESGFALKPAENVRLPCGGSREDF